MTKANVKAPAHIDWLVDTGKKLKTACGSDVDVLELQHANDAVILSAWAAHFRNQYCSDDMIDALKGKMSRKEYLENIKFPSKTKPGPSIRSGDFAEILLADYLEWRLKFWVPRLRWSGKSARDESAKGCDILGFHFVQNSSTSPKDVLAIIESKANLSASKKNRLQDAVTDSAKDDLRKGESLNAIKQRFVEQGKDIEAAAVERFQSPSDAPYQEMRAAAAVFSTDGYDEALIQTTDATSLKLKKGKKVIKHSHHGKLKMIVIKGDDLMNLVHSLYQRAADEA